MLQEYFARPDLLVWLAPLCGAGFALLWWASYYMRNRSRNKWGQPEIVDSYSPRVSKLSEVMHLTAYVLSGLLLACACAEPQIPDSERVVPSGRVNVVAVYDVSRSMQAEDYRHTMPAPDGTAGQAIIGPHGHRLAMSVYVTKTQIMPKLGKNKIGLVTFTQDGWPMWALTDDHDTAAWILDNWVDIGKAPGGGSDFVQGLKEAVNTFRMNELRTKAEADIERGKEKVIILFSDGAYTKDMESLGAVIKDIKEMKIRLIIIGVGNTTPQRIPVYDKDNNQTGWYQVKGKDAYTGLEDENLKTLAEMTGGEYIHLDPDTQLPTDWASKVGGGHIQAGKVPIEWILGLAGLALLTLVAMRGFLRSRTE